MIAVKIELWPGGRQVGAREIGRMYIANDGAGSIDRGDYKVAVCRRGSDDVPREIYDEADLEILKGEGIKPPAATRAGEVKDYPRLAYNVWRLIARAVLSAFPEEVAAQLKTQRDGKVKPVLNWMVAKGLRILADDADLVPEDCTHADTAEAVHAAIEWLDAANRDDA